MRYSILDTNTKDIDRLISNATNFVKTPIEPYFMMNVNGMSTIGLNNRIDKLNNFTHIVIDNGCHEATGKQEFHHDVDFIRLAQAACWI